MDMSKVKVRIAELEQADTLSLREAFYLEVMRELLKRDAQIAALTAEPVGYVDRNSLPEIVGGEMPVYATPPAPVDLSEVLDSFNSRGYEIEGRGVMLENLAQAAEMVFSQLSDYAAQIDAQPDLASLVPDEKIVPDNTIGWDIETICSDAGWNECRAEMLRRIEEMSE